jgi:hypothetical protein
MANGTIIIRQNKNYTTIGMGNENDLAGYEFEKSSLAVVPRDNTDNYKS